MKPEQKPTPDPKSAVMAILKQTAEDLGRVGTDVAASCVPFDVERVPARLEVVGRVLAENSVQPAVEYFGETCDCLMDDDEIARLGKQVVPTLIKLLSGTMAERFYAVWAIQIVAKDDPAAAEQAVPALQRSLWSFDWPEDRIQEYAGFVVDALRAIGPEANVRFLDAAGGVA